MNLTSAQVEEELEQRLKAAGLFKFVQREQSQFLDLWDGPFVEYVLNDASALADVEKIVRHKAEELRANGIELESVIRALWKVADVEYEGRSRAPDGGLRFAVEFRAILKSGTREWQVTVDVSDAALEILRQKLQSRDVDKEIIAPMVRSFLELLLSRGGTGFWDPLLNPRLSLSAADMSFLLGYGPAFEELRQAIDDALEPLVLTSFLADLSLSGTRIRDFEAVLPKLSNLLGGAYRRDQTFSTTAGELFSKLKRSEQELLAQYFRRKVEELENLPELKQIFPAVFSEGT